MKFKDLNLKLSYCAHWDAWDAVREIMANAQDVAGNSSGIRLDRVARTLTIWNKGDKPLMPHHLILGEHQNRGDKRTIGMFGEGLKVAITVLSRLGFELEIRSGVYRYYPVVRYPYQEESAVDLEGLFEEISEQLRNGTIESNEPVDVESYVRSIGVVGVEYVDDEKQVDGTEVIVKNWTGGDDFRSRFIRKDDARIVFTDWTDRHILREMPPNLYIDGVWYGEMPKTNAQGWAFGYDLSSESVQINRDRKVAAQFDVNWDAARLWTQCEDRELWLLFWQAVEAGMMEASLMIRNLSPSKKVADLMAATFREYHGEDVLLQTSRRDAEMAAGDGVEVIEISESIREVLQRNIPTDTEYLLDHTASSPVADDELTKDRKRVLRMLQTRTDKLCAQQEVNTAKWTPFVFDDSGTLARVDLKRRVILIAPSTLDEKDKALQVLIEELAHLLFGTQDNTRAHVNACCRVGAMLLEL